MSGLQTGTKWHDIDGDECVVIGIALHTDDGSLQVMYHQDGICFVRPAYEWYSLVQHNGEYRPLFEEQ